MDEAARVLEIEGQLDRRPANLSGGQRQRVAMGRAVVRDPRRFSSNLDAKLRVQTRTALSRLHERLGATTVYVTHDQVEAVTLGDRIAVTRGGRIQQVGTPAAVYEHPVNLFVAGVDSRGVSSDGLQELADERDAAGVASSAGGVQVVARLSAASAITQGREAQLWVDTSRLQLFDHETGRSLLTSENSGLAVPESSAVSRRRLAA